MKKGLLVLATLLLISCVNLNEHKGERVIVNTKSSGTKSNVANVQKNNKKKHKISLWIHQYKKTKN